MPMYLDRHDAPGVTAEELAALREEIAWPETFVRSRLLTRASWTGRIAIFVGSAVRTIAGGAK